MASMFFLFNSCMSDVTEMLCVDGLRETILRGKPVLNIDGLKKYNFKERYGR